MLSLYHVISFCVMLLSIISSAHSGNTDTEEDIDWSKTKIWGPGLRADFCVPARYFFIQLIKFNGDNYTQSAGERPFEVGLSQAGGQRVRVYMRVLDKKDGMYLITFRIYETLRDLQITITKDDKQLGDSPFSLTGPVLQDQCYCPQPSLQQWYDTMSCPQSYTQIESDLSIFRQVDLEETAAETIQRFNISTAHSLARYRVIGNKIYRKTYGQHVGFKMFSDAILLSLTRKVVLPDIELFVNLGDWPLERGSVSNNPVPIFSWCGSDSSRDIVMPTYDLTESSLEMLGRQSLDIFHVAGKSPAPWTEKEEKGFWRGRDSRQERLDLVVMSRENPDDLDAKMTRMFFFKHDQEKYGDLVQNIPFFDFFKYKYQINIDGTVAAYRFPYLLAGDAVVFKQESEYYEFFYKELEPFVHYIPFKHDLSDLREKIQWAKENDDKVREIGKNGQNYALQRLTPGEVFCYHVKVFEEYSKRLKSPPPQPDETWELVEQPKSIDCHCDRLAHPAESKSAKKSKKMKKDEL
ncbi:protein O-glucosyltransferase 2-like [Mya arenaria]|uniref:protein O-glucosyltransferase 2-like n=1 Tax=Mya arenaria TaxID=6604 RepID=UPI0022E96FF1|nr:protein O-glucosyltransferase 2-like [Mya arenaria]